MNKENSLEKIDNYFAAQPQNYLTLAMFLVFGVVGYLVYDYGFESSEEYLQDQTRARDETKKKLDELTRYIEQNKSSNTLSSLTKRLEDVKKDEELVDSDTQYFDQKLREVSKVLYNQENWAKFIAKVNKSAQEYRLDLRQVRSRRNNTSGQEVKEAFDMEFELSGKYQSILMFINDLEKAVEVVDVKQIKMSKAANAPAFSAQPEQYQGAQMPQEGKRPDSQNNINAHVFISIWGLKY